MRKIKTRITTQKSDRSNTNNKTPLEIRCKQKGLRINYARQVILQVITETINHMTTEEIYCKIRKGNFIKSLPLATIYNNLKRLTEANVLERKRIDSKWIYFAAADTGNNDQLIDVASGTVIALNGEAVTNLKNDIARKYGLNIEKYRIELHSLPGEDAADTDNINRLSLGSKL